jgi:hypothetical protein
MEKLFVAWLLFCEVEKKFVELPSGEALTAMDTPLAGMADVIFTTKGKFGPGAAGWVLPAAGVRVTAKVASGVLLLPPHPPITKQRKATAHTAEKNRFMKSVLSVIKITLKLLFSLPLIP